MMEKLRLLRAAMMVPLTNGRQDREKHQSRTVGFREKMRNEWCFLRESPSKSVGKEPTNGMVMESL